MAGCIQSFLLSLVRVRSPTCQELTAAFTFFWEMWLQQNTAWHGLGTHLLAGPSPSTVSQNSSFNPQNKPRGDAGTITASQMGKLSL